MVELKKENFRLLSDTELSEIEGGRDWLMFTFKGVTIVGATMGATALGGPVAGAFAAYAAGELFDDVSAS